MIKVNGKEIEFTKFPNGETNMNHESFPDLKDKYVNIHFKYVEDGDLIKLMFVKNYIDSTYLQKTVSRLFIYQMPYSRMDRSENHSPFTLKYVSNLINGLDFSEIYIIEPHSNVTLALVNNSYALYINFDLIDNVTDAIGFNEKEDYIMFPDNGASSRYKDMTYPNVLVGHKKRDFATGKIQGLDVIGNITNPNKVLIVDDLSSYGGTFVHSSKKLKELGFKEVYLLIAHAENSIFKGELFDHIDKVFTTDSMITEHNNWENVKFEPQLKIFKLEDYLID